ncbi:hypothetical protein [Candidatus Halobonum tyrrellensis]|uniref:hypothetical protein n=1 Tax=Candidatus Halobonum tyrrellensis TaxID=1431545 RepID=UPI001378578D|nr:hypothetical protein [Candidatus Halobonum tyrrellensis]
MTTTTACEHCHADMRPADVAEPTAGTIRCKRCGGRALRNRSAVERLLGGE